MDLLLDHQNGEFKRFRADKGALLQESDVVFRQHALTSKSLQKKKKRDLQRIKTSSAGVGMDGILKNMLCLISEA